MTTTQQVIQAAMPEISENMAKALAILAKAQFAAKLKAEAVK
jgi:hypothetical protein